MTADVKIEPNNPLPAEALEEDARKAGVDADEQTTKDGDTHLPASESAHAGEHRGKPADVERDVTELPPG